MDANRDKYTALVAAQPSAFRVLEPMLADIVQVTPAHTIPDAIKILERTDQKITLIVCTVAFDESRLCDFLQAVKNNKRTSRIPFIGCRVLASVLSDDSMDRLKQVCRSLGAADFVDLARVEKQLAPPLLRTLVMKYLPQ